MSDNGSICPFCGGQMKRFDEMGITFSHSGDLDEWGNTKDCYFSHWECECGIYAQQWYDDDPPTDFGIGAEKTGEWTYYKSAADYAAWRDSEGVLHVENDGTSASGL